MLQRGELIFHIGGCTNCHTAKNGALLAGGDAIASPVGDFYAPNITPDPETGIGGWSLEQFTRAMREGRDPEGWPLYPAFPYTSYTHMTDEDLAALKAYLDTLPAVSQPSKPHELWFPFNIRWGLYLWQWLFFTPERFQPDPPGTRPGTAAPIWCWRRAIAPSATRHAPSMACSNGTAPSPVRSSARRRCPTSPPTPPRAWASGVPAISSTLFTLGMTPNGDFVGSEMAKVVNNGTSKLPEADVAAIVAYLQSLPSR